MSSEMNWGTGKPVIKTGWKIGIVAGVVAFIFILFVALCIERINPGYVGVVYTPNKGVSENTLSQGWHVVSPFNKVTSYTIATEQAYLSKDSREGSESDDSFSVVSKDGKNINVDVEFAYRFDSEKLTDIFNRFRGQTGEQIRDTFIRGKVKSWASEATSQFAVIEIYSDKRSEVNAEAFKRIRDKFAEYGIIIESFNFSRIDLDDATEKAIQERINAQQGLEKIKIEVESAKLEAEKKAAEAKGEADRKKIEAQGIADANKLLEQTLSDKVLLKMYLEKWDGKLPQVSGTTANPLIDLQNSLK